MNLELENSKKHKHYFCNICDFQSSNRNDYNRHNLTLKHKNQSKPKVFLTEKLEKTPNHLFGCICGNVYKHKSTLCAHKKKCKIKDDKCDNESLTNLVIEVVKSNTELQKQNDEFKSMLLEQNSKIIDMCKNNNTNITNNNVNSHNKAFNLNVFLNEDCKDAMNVTQFIDSFNLQLSDFENVGNLGFVNGISDIIIKKLKSLDISERPIHCTDQKRHVLYAKVIDKWEKEGDDNKILRRIIKCVAFKNSKNIQLFRDKYPDCMNWDSKHADRYQILRIESLGGLNNEDVDNENKIIRKIAREITIDKSL